MIRLLACVVLLFLTGCARQETKCVDGFLYQRMFPTDPWTMVDAAPNHQGITPTPCLPNKDKSL